jgi:nitrite reductase/ring-hydroxylating ferredoxin subunit
MDQTESAPEGFLPAIHIGELQLDRPRRVKTANGYVVIALYELDGAQTVAAFTPICPHAMGDLSYGMIYRGQVECPVHGYRFDAATGECVWPAGESPLRIYPTRVVDGLVYVKVEKPKWMAS